jgi:polysaccharide export outer membrane protein
LKAGLGVLLLATLAACESLPHDGPSAKMVAKAAVPDGPYTLIDLDYRIAQTVDANPPRVLASLAGDSSAAPIDRIGPGDVLNVWIYQSDAGPALVSSIAGPRAASVASPASPNLTVESDGTILAPYAGTVRVAGLTPVQASEVVRNALVGKVINPQAVVSVAANVSNTVTVMGEVRAPGRFALTAGNDRLLDILALSGGSTRPTADTELTVVRGARSATLALGQLLSDPAQNIRLAPRDQIRLTYRPRKFSTFGALTRASQVPIEDDRLTLAGADPGRSAQPDGRIEPRPR